jgi:hypothetical protein
MQLSRTNHPRVTISSLVLVLCCMMSSARLIIDAPTPKHVLDSASEIPKRSDQRFAELKTMLPDRGVVGYVGESGSPAEVGYYLAQYALAPLVVDRSPNHPLVVGNFRISTPPPPENLKLVKDFGNGVLLFANELATNKGNQ